jgi:hypothetical protein
MPPTATLRAQIESFLEHRFPAALSPAPRAVRETAPIGIESIDAQLSGGLPIGAISEITGPASSGRTSLALAFLARRTAEGRVCAWVDVDDALDPASAAASGIALPQLLWIRCRQAQPRPPEKAPAPRQRNPIWNRLDQALRATDLLLLAGGFAAIVLDLGDTAREHASRIPLATWFRYRQASDRTRASLLVLGQAAYAQSSAAVVLECAPLQPHAAGGTVLRGFTAQVRRGRERFSAVEIGTRKPPASTWTACAQWESAGSFERTERRA